MKLSFNKFKRLSNEQERKIKSEMSSEDTGVIHLDDVTHFYQNDSSPTIENLNLRIKHGEFISILGESGAGKTTTLRMIAGFEKISSGYLRIGGQLVGSNFLQWGASYYPFLNTTIVSKSEVDFTRIANLPELF